MTSLMCDRSVPSVRRAIASSVVVVAGALLLSGCIKLDADMKVAKNDKFSGTQIVALNAKAFEGLGLKKAELRKQMQDSLKTSGKDLPAGVKSTSKLYEKGDYIGIELSLTEAPISALPALLSSAQAMAATTGASGGDGKNKVALVHKGGKFLLTGAMDLSSDTKTSDGGPDVAALLAAYKPELKIKLTFPGKVKSGTGKISGNSITFTPKFGEKNKLNAEANDG